VDAEQTCTSITLRHVVRTVLFADLVESCRLSEYDEEDTAARWQSLRAAIEARIIPMHGGRLIRTEGDGLMVLFLAVRPAVDCALSIQQVCRSAQLNVPADRRLLLRMSLHETELFEDERDVYGRGVNLAARLYTLAGPDEIVVSARVREQLGPEFAPMIEDLSECHLKHLAHPVHAYRLGKQGPRPVIALGTAFAPELRPTVAIIPFTAQRTEPGQAVLGEILADEIIAALSRTNELQVISRLSTSALRDRRITCDETAALLDARYIFSGAYRTSGDKLVLVVQLADAKLHRIVWADILRESLSAFMAGDAEVVQHVVGKICVAIIAHELEHARSRAPQTLESSTLLISAIALMHRGVVEEFKRAGEMLDVLTERARMHAEPQAWLAKWHVLRFNRGWTDDRAGEARAALDCTHRALDADSQCSLALAIEGFVNTNLLRKLEIGEERYTRALSINPNDSLAWLFKGTLHAFKGEGELAVEATQAALKLSPLDPLRSFYESLGATAALSAGQYEQAIQLAQRSLRTGRTNSSTLRALAIAQSELGRMNEARATVKEVLAIEPGLTVQSYLERSPSAAYATGQAWSAALGRAGLPA